MFKFIRNTILNSKKAPLKSSEKDPQLAGRLEGKTSEGMTGVIFLAADDFADRTRLENALSSEFPEAANDIGSDTDKSDPVVFFYERSVCAVMCMDLQAPMANTDPEFRNAWFWPAAWEELSKHRAHFMVSVSGADDARTRGLIFQRLIRTLLAASPSAIGMHYSSGTLLPARLVSHMLDKTDELALMMFVSCFFAREKEGTFPESGVMASTSGLSQFGPLEIEARGFPGSQDVLHSYLLTFATGLLEQQSKYKDGDTVTVESVGTARIRIVKSMFYDANVYCLYFQ